MIEVEVKLPVRDLAVVREELRKMGFQRKQLLREEDHYYDSEEEAIRRGGEALRIRRTLNLHTNREEVLVTFKGKKMDQVSMTRTELETSVGDATVMHQLLGALGYHEVLPSVIKTRDELSREDMNACLDEVEGLGEFLELEIVLEDGQDQRTALDKIEELLHTLGYGLKDTTRTSYLSQLQNRED